VFISTVDIVLNFKNNRSANPAVVITIIIMCLLFAAASSPNIDSYVFVKVVNDVAGIVVEEETGDAGYGYLSSSSSLFGELTGSS